MKLRIRGNSLRLRLTQQEVAQFLAKGKVSESVQFSPAATDRLVYSLESCQQASTVFASFGNGEVRITLPVSAAAKWTSTDQVGIEHIQSIGEEFKLRILVEKDFRCLQPRSDEDESDNFPNPECSVGTHLIAP